MLVSVMVQKKKKKTTKNGVRDGSSIVTNERLGIYILGVGETNASAYWSTA
jgi:hypothetical protein